MEKNREKRYVPIIMIFAKASDYDKVLALGVGADDYLTKPFSMIELVARVKSHLRRATQFAERNKTEHKKKVFGKVDDTKKVLFVHNRNPFWNSSTRNAHI